MFRWGKSRRLNSLRYSNVRKQLIGRWWRSKRVAWSSLCARKYIWSLAITRNVPLERPKELSGASSVQTTNTVVAAASHRRHQIQTHFIQIFLASCSLVLSGRRLSKHVFVWLSEIEGIVSIRARLCRHRFFDGENAFRGSTV